jgi:hypothetical protein
MSKPRKTEGATLLTAVCVTMAGLWLISDPQCRRGCKTVAQHLVEHGIGDFFGTLLS